MNVETNLNEQTGNVHNGIPIESEGQRRVGGHLSR
jgi:hypothetical protein